MLHYISVRNIPNKVRVWFFFVPLSVHSSSVVFCFAASHPTHRVLTAAQSPLAAGGVDPTVCVCKGGSPGRHYRVLPAWPQGEDFTLMHTTSDSSHLHKNTFPGPSTQHLLAAHFPLSLGDYYISPSTTGLHVFLITLSLSSSFLLHSSLNRSSPLSQWSFLQRWARLHHLHAPPQTPHRSRTRRSLSWSNTWERRKKGGKWQPFTQCSWNSSRFQHYFPWV